MSKSYFLGDVRPQFVLSNQDGVLVGHNYVHSKEKLICSPEMGNFHLHYLLGILEIGSKVRVKLQFS